MGTTGMAHPRAPAEEQVYARTHVPTGSDHLDATCRGSAAGLAVRLRGAVAGRRSARQRRAHRSCRRRLGRRRARVGGRRRHGVRRARWSGSRGVSTPWPMYERLVAEPRLTSWWTGADGPEPLAVLASGASACSGTATGARSRRSASTSIATARTPWPGTATVCMTAATRWSRSSAWANLCALQLRPAPGCPASSGSATHSFPLGDGTLLVMGGTCQATWQHRVPKSNRHTGPRMSITFRARQCRAPGRPGGAGEGCGNLTRCSITKAAEVPITPAITAVARAACALVNMPERNACSSKISRNQRSETPCGGQLRFELPFTPYITTTTSGR